MARYIVDATFKTGHDEIHTSSDTKEELLEYLASRSNFEEEMFVINHYENGEYTVGEEWSPEDITEHLEAFRAEKESSSDTPSEPKF